MKFSFLLCLFLLVSPFAMATENLPTTADFLPAPAPQESVSVFQMVSLKYQQWAAYLSLHNAFMTREDMRILRKADKNLAEAFQKIAL